MSDYLTTAQAGVELNVSDKRIVHLIKSRRLPAKKFGRVWLIDPKDLAAVRHRRAGRPRGKAKPA